MGESSQCELQFLRYDPNKPRATGRKAHALNENVDEQLKCQTCFTPFGSDKALRDHVGAFQLEKHQLIARLMEAEAHLPASRGPANQISHCDDEYDDDFDEDNGDEGEDQTQYQCPHLVCRQRKGFNSWLGLLRHFTIHVECFELCVYCRESFTRLRPYVRHKCRVQERHRSTEKDFYKKERCSQLRGRAADSLQRMLATGSDTTKLDGTRKRERSTSGACVDQQPHSKRSMLFRDGETFRSPDRHDFMPEEPSQSTIPIHPPQQPASLPPSQHHRPDHHANDRPNAGISSTLQAGNHTFGVMEASIFDDLTITPFYDMSQDPHQQLAYQYQPVIQGLPGRHVFRAPSLDVFPVHDATQLSGIQQTDNELVNKPY